MFIRRGEQLMQNEGYVSYFVCTIVSTIYLSVVPERNCETFNHLLTALRASTILGLKILTIDYLDM